MRYIFLIMTIVLMLDAALPSKELNLTQKEKEWLEKHPVIKVSNSQDWTPFDFSVNGIAKGYSVDLIKELSKKIGIEVQFVNGYTWSQLLEMFDNNEIDMMHVMAWTEQRVQKYAFSKPYMPFRNSYMIRADEKNINSCSDLDGKKIASVKGWYIVDVIKKAYPKATVVEFDNSLEILQALSTGKVDIAVDNIIVAKHFMAENFITNIKHGGYIQEGQSEKEHLYFVANKNKPELMSIFDKAYQLLTLDDKLSLQNRWLAHVEEKAIVFSAEEKSYLENKKVITMCIDPNWMPFEKFDTNGKHIGMTAEYFNIFRNELGIPIEVVNTSTWSESIEAAKVRKCDIYSLAMQTPERKKYMDFTSAYMQIPLVLATQLDVPFISEIKYIKRERVGIVKGYAFNEFIKKRYPNIEVIDVENINEGLQKVANGELFGFVGTLASVGYAFQKDFVGELKISGKFSEKWELGIGTRNDEPLLNSIFEKAINSLSPKEHQEILNRYIAIKYEKTTDYDLLIKVVSVALLLFLIGFYYTRRLSSINKKLKKLQTELQEQAIRDPLTNLYNRRYLYDVASNLMKISKRDCIDIGIIMIDIDYFKQINDNYGHAVGDAVLQKLSRTLLAHSRESDMIFRTGGEEFVVLLPNTNKKGSYTIASKLRASVEQEVTVLIGEEKEANITLSLGVDQVLKDDENIDNSLNRSDQALYKAKENGRNQVVVYEDIV